MGDNGVNTPMSMSVVDNTFTITGEKPVSVSKFAPRLLIQFRL